MFIENIQFRFKHSHKKLIYNTGFNHIFKVYKINCLSNLVLLWNVKIKVRKLHPLPHTLNHLLISCYALKQHQIWDENEKHKIPLKTNFLIYYCKQEKNQTLFFFHCSPFSLVNENNPLCSSVLLNECYESFDHSYREG